MSPCRAEIERERVAPIAPRAGSILIDTESIYRRYAIQDETMLREASAKLEAWTDEQKTKTLARGKGQVKRFKRRKAS